MPRVWYPKLADVLEVYERMASFEGCEAEVRDRAALDRAVVAPQRAAGDDPTPEVLAKKAAALMRAVLRPRLFAPCTRRTAFALVSVFLDRNGMRFQASMDRMDELFAQVEEGTMGPDALADWIEARVEVRRREQNARRMLSALDRVARVIEELEGRPGLHRQVNTLDEAGNAICLELAVLHPFEGGGREYVRDGYPAVDDRWGDAFAG